MDALPDWISRRQYYHEKKEAIRWMGYYFFEMVVLQVRKKSILSFYDDLHK